MKNTRRIHGKYRKNTWRIYREGYDIDSKNSWAHMKWLGEQGQRLKNLSDVCSAEAATEIWLIESETDWENNNTCYHIQELTQYINWWTEIRKYSGINSWTRKHRETGIDWGLNSTCWRINRQTQRKQSCNDWHRKTDRQKDNERNMHTRR